MSEYQTRFDPSDYEIFGGTATEEENGSVCIYSRHIGHAELDMLKAIARRNGFKDPVAYHMIKPSPEGVCEVRINERELGFSSEPALRFSRRNNFLKD